MRALAEKIGTEMRNTLTFTPEVRLVPPQSLAALGLQIETRRLLGGKVTRFLLLLLFSTDCVLPSHIPQSPSGSLCPTRQAVRRTCWCAAWGRS